MLPVIFFIAAVLLGTANFNPEPPRLDAYVCYSGDCA